MSTLVLRKESTNEADKDFLKLMINCIYGKVVNLLERGVM